MKQIVSALFNVYALASVYIGGKNVSEVLKPERPKPTSWSVAAKLRPVELPEITSTNLTLPSSAQPFSISKWLKEMHKVGYDRLIHPGAFEGKPTDVQVQVYVESIGNFRASAMDYELDVFFIEHWTDARLKHNERTFLIFNDKSEVDRLWTPDIYFANSKMAMFNYVMVPNLNIRIWPNGKIRMATRVTMKLLCHMNLLAFPVDKQICTIKIMTSASSQDVVNVTWAIDNALTLDSSIQPTDLQVYHVKATNCTAVYYGYSYSCLLGKFYLQRSIIYSLLQTYVPSIFIVMISWISFWIDPSSVPGRVGLTLTTLLTLSTQAIGKQVTLPPVGYAKALDVWFGICITFLFGTLIEFAMVNMYAQLEQRQMTVATITTEIMANLPSMTQSTYVDNDFVSPKEQEIYLIKSQAKEYRKKAMFVDQFARLAFPITFIIVCIIYWATYLTVANNMVSD